MAGKARPRRRKHGQACNPNCRYHLNRPTVYSSVISNTRSAACGQAGVRSIPRLVSDAREANAWRRCLVLISMQQHRAVQNGGLACAFSSRENQHDYLTTKLSVPPQLRFASACPRPPLKEAKEVHRSVGGSVARLNTFPCPAKNLVGFIAPFSCEKVRSFSPPPPPRTLPPQVLVGDSRRIWNDGTPHVYSSPWRAFGPPPTCRAAPPAPVAAAAAASLAAFRISRSRSPPAIASRTTCGSNRGFARAPKPTAGPQMAETA